MITAISVLGIWLVSVLPVGLLVASSLRRAGIAGSDDQIGAALPAMPPVPALTTA